jgi:phosphohistidine phosphatase SixA
MAEIRFWGHQRILFAAILVLLACLFVSGYLFFYRPVTTVILVRHAEKNIEPNNPNPTLSTAGQARAQELVHVLGNAGITAIYATQYLRTQQTAQPLADRLGLRITQVNSSNSGEVISQIKANHTGDVVFVTGHNNTVPAIIAGLGGGSLPIIPESEYDNMFVVMVYRFGKAKTVQLKYGSAKASTANQQIMNTP